MHTDTANDANKTRREVVRSHDVIAALIRWLETGRPLTVHATSDLDAEVFGPAVTVGRRCLAVPDGYPYEIAGNDISPCWSLADAARTVVRWMGKRAVAAALAQKASA